MKIIIPTLAAGVLFFGGIWVWMRTEIVVVPKKEVSQWDTQEAVRRLKLAEGVFEPDVNGELAMITIYESKISESGWGLLGRMHNLRKLVLNDCEITDDGLVHLSDHHSRLVPKVVAALDEMRHLSKPSVKARIRNLVKKRPHLR